MRLIDARLQAVSSKNMYSEHGLLALMRPSVGHVCHSLIVVSYCRPGSADAHAENVIFSHKSFALTFFATLPEVRNFNSHSPSVRTECMKSLVTRTELFEFCPETVWYASPS